MLTQFTNVFAKDDVNIENMWNKSKGNFAYSVLDVCSPISEQVVKDLEAIPEVIRVRTIK